MKKENTFTAFNIDRSLYQVPVDPDTGKPATEITITPVYTKNNGLIIDEINWSILDTSSNFKNSTDYTTVATIQMLTNSNVNSFSFKVKDLQLGEVVFVKIQAAAIEFNRNDQDEPIIGSVKERLVAVGYAVICRGDPINTKFLIHMSSNGTLNNQGVFDSPIEEQIYSIIERRVDDPFKKDMPNQLGHSNDADRDVPFQVQKQSLREHLAFFHNVVTTSPLGNYITEHKIEGGKAQTIIKTSDGIGIDQDVHTSVGFSLPTQENVLYAHGRSIDMASIATLEHQNPENRLHGNKQAPSKELQVAAIINRRNQPQGHNRVIKPLYNPAVNPNSENNRKNLKGKAFQAFFPGRSTHKGWGVSYTKCGTQTFESKGGSLGYPACAGEAGNPLCGGFAVSIPFCLEASLCCGDCDIYTSKCPGMSMEKELAHVTLNDGTEECRGVSQFTYTYTSTYTTFTTISNTQITPGGGTTITTTPGSAQKTKTMQGTGTSGFYLNHPNGSLYSECYCDRNNIKLNINSAGDPDWDKVSAIN